MYADMYVNMACKCGVCFSSISTHGEGEDLTVSSPAESAGSRQDPIGHLPFWQKPVAGTYIGGIQNFSRSKTPHFQLDPASLGYKL